MAPKTLGLLRGCRAIAAFFDGSDERWRGVPALAREGYPIFKLSGQWVARPEALVQEVCTREQQARTAASAAATTNT